MFKSSTTTFSLLTICLVSLSRRNHTFKKVSKGITVRVLAKANSKVKYANGNKSELPFHRSPDGAAVIPLDGGGYVYVSNSEVSKSKGGVYGLYFDHDGKVMDYKALLSGTSMNCGGGEYTTLLS